MNNDRGVNFRLCSDSEGLSILNEPQIKKRLGAHSETIKVTPWICQLNEFRMMFVFWFVSEGVYEVHIACPKDSVIKSVDLSRSIISFLFFCGAKKIVTSCPKGTASNLALKLGMDLVKTDGKINYFKVDIK